MAKTKKVSTTPISVMLGYQKKAEEESSINDTVDTNSTINITDTIDTSNIKDTTSVDTTNNISETIEVSSTTDVESTESINGANSMNEVNSIDDTANTKDTSDTVSSTDINSIEDTNDTSSTINHSDTTEDDTQYFTSSIRYEMDIYEKLRILKNFEPRKTSSINSFVNKILREYVSNSDNEKKIEMYQNLFSNNN